MKKAFIYAYTKTNLGDDLFVKILCERYPDVVFFMKCNKKNSNAFKNINNLRLVTHIRYVDRILNHINPDVSFNRWLQRTISARCDAIITIGGSIFMQKKHHWKRTVKRFESRLIPNIPFFILGSNFGPFHEVEYLEAFRRIFSSVTDVCFRDKYSYNLFSDLPNIRYAPDIIFSLSSKYKNEIKLPTHIMVKKIIISVIDKSLGKKNDDYYKFIMKVIQTMVSDGYSIVLMGFCSAEGDERAVEKICDLFVDDTVKTKIEKYVYDGNIDEALAIIEQSDFIFASRFHAMILGWVFGKPVYPYIYSDKSTNVLKDIRFEGTFSKIIDPIMMSTDDFIKLIFKNKPVNTDMLSLSSVDHFSKLDTILNN